MDPRLSQQLSAEDLLKAVPGSVFYRYPDLRKFRSIDELLPSPTSVVFILYETEPNSGHWTSLLRDKEGTICFTDPYGLCVDQELRFVKPEERRALHEDRPILLSLLVKGNKTGENWEFSKYDYQSKDPRVQDCGRWAILRALKRNLSSDEFHAWITKEAKKDGGDYDETAVRLTQPLLDST